MDHAWWAHYLRQTESFTGERWTASDCAHAMRLHRVRCAPIEQCVNDGTAIATGGNSGHCAISIAILSGARRVVLLGYDMGAAGGRNHWHPDHPAGMGNAGKFDAWIQRMSAMAAGIDEVEIINCSRASALTCFRRQRLKEVLVP